MRFQTTAEEGVEALLAVADGAIIGTSLKRDGQVENPVDSERVRRLVQRSRAA